MEDITQNCIEWDKALTHEKYGRTYYKGNYWVAHRAIWDEVNGTIPKDMLICHKCDNPPCINIDHLFLGTVSDNAIDSVIKKRHKESRKNNCKHGHPFEGNNLRLEISKHRNNPKRRCKECNKLKARAYRKGEIYV